MPDDAPESPGTENQDNQDTQQQDPPKPDPKPTETVDYWKDKAREWENRAKANKSAADELARIKDSQKSDADKLADAERRAAEAEAKVVRRDKALEYKLSKEDAALLDAVLEEDAIDKLAKRLAAAAEEKKTSGPRSPRVGNNPRPTEDEERAAVRSLFGGGAA